MLFPNVALTIHSDSPLRPMIRFQTCVYPAGCESPGHESELRQTILVLSGKGMFHETGREAVICTPGVLLSLPTGRTYRWRMDRETTLFQCHHQPFNALEHRALAGLFGSLQDHLTAVRLPEALFIELARRIATDIALPPVSRGVALSADMLRLMATAAELASGDTPDVDPPGHSAFVRALSHLEANVHRDVSLAELARQAGLGPSRLAQLFRQHTGHSPKRHFAMLKAERATALLLAEGLRAADIADRLGFASESYFRRFYRRQTGRTPGSIRRCR